MDAKTLAQLELEPDPAYSGAGGTSQCDLERFLVSFQITLRWSDAQILELLEITRWRSQIVTKQLQETVSRHNDVGMLALPTVGTIVTSVITSSCWYRDQGRQRRGTDARVSLRLLAQSTGSQGHAPTPAPSLTPRRYVC